MFVLPTSRRPNTVLAWPDDLGISPRRGGGGGRWILIPPFKVPNIVVCPLSRGSSGRIRGVGAISKLADAKGIYNKGANSYRLDFKSDGVKRGKLGAYDTILDHAYL